MTIRLLLSIAVLCLAGLITSCGGGADVAEDDPVFAPNENDIYEAAKAGDVETVKRIIMSGDWDYGAADGSGKTPLEYAVENGNGQIVELMIMGGAPPNTVGSDGRSMLQIARDEGNQEAEKVLVHYGAK